MTLQGPDVSHYQGNPVWSIVAGAGNSFTFLKATEGTSYVDPTLASNRAKAHAAGLTVGYYHFARNGDPIAEANHFCDAIGPLSPGDLAVLDWEVPGNAPAFAKPFLAQVRARLGVTPGIYLNTYYLTNFDWSEIIAGDYWLWFAKYNSRVNDAPVWPTCAFKQFTSTGQVPGISGAVDVNVFYGDAHALSLYGKVSSVAEIPTIQTIGEVLWVGGTGTPRESTVYQRVARLETDAAALANTLADIQSTLNAIATKLGLTGA